MSEADRPASAVASEGGYVAEDRRPIRSRDAGLSKRIADRLVGWGCRANAISLLGMGFAVSAGGLLWVTSLTDRGAVGGAVWRMAWLGAAGLIQMRLLCNMFDGMVAIRSGRASALGELYNEVPDRFSDAAVLLGLGYAWGSSPAAGWAATAVALTVAYIRAVGKSAGVPQVFHGPMAKPQRMFAVTVAALWMGLTPLGWGAWGSERWTVSVPTLTLWVVILGGLWTFVRRLRVIAGRLKVDPAGRGDV